MMLPLLETKPLNTMLVPAHGTLADTAIWIVGVQGIGTEQRVVLVTVEKIKSVPMGSVPFATTLFEEGLAVAR